MGRTSGCRCRCRLQVLAYLGALAEMSGNRNTWYHGTCGVAGYIQSAAGYLATLRRTHDPSGALVGLSAVAGSRLAQGPQGPCQRGPWEKNSLTACDRLGTAVRFHGAWWRGKRGLPESGGRGLRRP